ncbi:MAG: hypothetical protein AB3K77_12575 [Methanosarcinaceae archaeon]
MIDLAENEKTKETSTNSLNDERGRGAKPGKTLKDYIPYLIIFASLLLVILYLLLSGVLSQDSSSNPNLEGDVYIEPVLYSGEVPEPVLKPEFASLFLDNVPDTRRVKLLMDPMNVETEGKFESLVLDQASILYISDSVRTDYEVEYSIYEMESPEAASQVLDYYTTEKGWNTVPMQIGNVTFWLWEGYKENARRPANMEIYWDNSSNGAFLPIDRRGTYYIARSSEELMCLHGECAKDKYFIMVDIHAPMWKVNDFGDYFFTEAAAKLNALDTASTK